MNTIQECDEGRQNGEGKGRREKECLKERVEKGGGKGNEQRLAAATLC